MIGRLVQQEQIRLLQEQLAKRGARLLAAAEVRGGRGLLLARESQPVQHLAYALLDGVAAGMLDLRLELAVALQHAGIGVGVGEPRGIAHARAERLKLVVPGLHVAKDGAHLVVQAALGMEIGDLRQVADGNAALEGDGAFIRRQDAGE